MDFYFFSKGEPFVGFVGAPISFSWSSVLPPWPTTKGVDCAMFSPLSYVLQLNLEPLTYNPHPTLLSPSLPITYNDRLKVDVSTDCGATYTNIYDKDGLDLSTLPGYNSTSSWAPNSGSDWRTETIDLSSYANQNVKIRFVSINDYSNSTYIDNIVVTGTLSTNRVDFDDHFTLFPNPVDDSFTVRSKQADIKKVVIYNLLGREVSTLKIDGIQQLVNINTTSLSSGVYLVRLESDLGVFHKKIVKK